MVAARPRAGPPGRRHFDDSEAGRLRRRPAANRAGRTRCWLSSAGSAHRPRFDPGLAGGLRAWLEDAAGDVVAAAGTRPPLFLGPRQLLGPRFDRRPTRRREAPGPRHRRLGARPLPASRHHRFRRLPADRRARGARPPPSRPAGTHIAAGSCGPGPRSRAALTTLVSHLRDSCPASRRGGCPAPTTGSPFPWPAAVWCSAASSTCWSGRRPAGPRSARSDSLGRSVGRGRHSLHFLALLETLRSGTPPVPARHCSTRPPAVGVEDVREEHLRAIASHLVTQLCLGRADDRAR